MIKDNQEHLNRFHILLDAIVVLVSYWFAWILRFKSGIMYYDPKHPFGFWDYMMMLILIVPLYLGLYAAMGMYNSRRVLKRKHEVSNLIKANFIAMMVILTFLYVIKQPHFSRQLIIVFLCVNLTTGIISKLSVRWLLHTIRSRGYNLKHVVLVGYSRAAQAYIDRMQANPQWGYCVRGILDDNIDRGTIYKGVKVLGKIDNLDIILPANKLDEIAITLGLDEYYKLEHIVELCEKSGVHTKFIPDYNHIIPTKPYTEDVQGLPVINIRYVPLTNTFNMLVKRIFDIVGSLFAIILTSPIMLLVAILIKLTSKGPIIYSQERIGLHNKTFKMYKFRSMQVQKSTEERKAWTVKDDPRVTAIGKILRKTSIDEFPQFFNVLMGQMSLVGPRPERPYFVDKFKEEIPRYMVKHQVRPGLTGWAQVNGYRGDTSIKKRIEYDLYYIENWSVSFDIKVLILTVFKGFINKNAY